MRQKSFNLGMIILCFFFSPVLPLIAKNQEIHSSAPILIQEIKRLSAMSDGTLGVCAIHIETGREICFNGKHHFPMASTYKIPIALQLLKLTDEGKVDLKFVLEIKNKDLRPSSLVTELMGKAGLQVSIQNLLEMMILVSDNTAGDLILKLAGGPDKVTERMKNWGFEQIKVSRTLLEMVMDSYGLKHLPDEPYSYENFKKIQDSVASEAQKKINEKFIDDLRDTTTPQDMTRLLAALWEGRLLTQKSSQHLMELMKKCKTGEQRIKGMLPKNTDFAHKTGSIAGAINDVGIITLPQNKGHLAIALYFKGSKKEMTEKEKIIGEVARTIYDYFLFN